MAVWQTSAQGTLDALAPRLPAMMDRAWFPGAMRTFADFQARYNSTNAKLQRLLPARPPAPPSPPPKPGSKLTPVPGACRDKAGGYSARIETLSSAAGDGGLVQFSQCMALCTSLGLKCDAVDIGGKAPAAGKDKPLNWCAVWGAQLTGKEAYNKTAFRFRCDESCADGTGGRVCRGDTAKNADTCYRREPFC